MQSFHFDTIDSTNEAAKRMIEAGRLNGPAYLLAREQTGGKGRHGQIWLSPRDTGIYLSVVELPGQAVGTMVTMFTLAAGVACVEALKETAGVEVKLKPINDLYARGAKLGGILTEAVLERGSVKALITGVGINVRVVDRPLPIDAPRPICLEQLMPEPRFRKLDHDALVAALVSRIQAWNATAGLGDIDAIKTAWEEHKIPGAAFPEA